MEISTTDEARRTIETPHAHPITAIIERTATDPDRGLATDDAAARLERDGPNRLREDAPTPLWRRFLGQFNDPLIYLLLAAIAVSIVAWVVEGARGAPIDAIVIAAIIVLNAVIGVIQEGKAAQAVASLQQMTAPKSTVVRDGATRRIPSADLVTGDVLLLEEGDQVAADARLVTATNLLVGEAALTGESSPVDKQAGEVDVATPLAERTGMVYAGTAVAQGVGRAVVTGTGMRTEMGGIAELLQGATDEPTPLEREISFVGRVLTIAVIVIAIVVMATVYLITPDHSISSIITILLLGVSLAVAAVPEGLPAILSLVLALGVRRMAEHKAIVTKLSSVETLGSATVICTDKTGTLTRNEMTIERVVTPDASFTLDELAAAVRGAGTGTGTSGRRDAPGRADAPGRVDAPGQVDAPGRALAVIALGTIANNAQVDFDGPRAEVLGDPTEAAFLLAERTLTRGAGNGVGVGVDVDGSSGGSNGSDGERADADADADAGAGAGASAGGAQAFTRAHAVSRVREIPFSSARKLMSVVVEAPGRSTRGGSAVSGDTTTSSDAAGAQRVLVAKGAPDVLLERCSRVRTGAGDVDLTPQQRDDILAQVDDLTTDAYRTLGVACRAVDDGLLEGADDELERDLTWIGVVGIVDPPRSEAADAIAECAVAGIRVVMITGDHPTTAARIAGSLGIATDASATEPDASRTEPDASGTGGDRAWPAALTGTDLDRLDADGFDEAVRHVNVYARVAPAHKLRIVERLQAHGEIVSMTGDGVNDAPALKQADIGVAMGITGTQVTREAADMVLADDNFATIVRAVREGRGIFANIRTFLRYLLSSNMGEVLTVFLGVAFAGVIGLVGDDGVVILPLLATQILWINLLTDSAPALALGVDPVPDDVMRRSPRRPDERVIDGGMWSSVALIGVVMAVVTLAALDLALPGGLFDGSESVDVGRTMAFTVLVFAQLFNTINCRSDTVSAFVGLLRNRWLAGAVLLSIVLQVLVVYVPFLNVAFGTAPLRLEQWLVCIALASAVLWFDELKKLVVRGLRSPAAER